MVGIKKYTNKSGRDNDRKNAPYIVFSRDIHGFYEKCAKSIFLIDPELTGHTYMDRSSIKRGKYTIK